MKKIVYISILVFVLIGNQKGFSQENPYVGQIKMFAGNFAPAGWMFCEGQLLPISEYETLFVIIGTTYGGDGQTTFALPDLRGRLPMHTGTGQGLTPRVIGEMGGSENVTLTINQMPAHNHLVNAVTADGNQSTPTGSLYANTKVLDKEYSDAASNTVMKSTMVGNTGGNQSIDNRQPSLAVSFIISLYGIFPSQN